jgi:hypothetical protein
MSANAKTIANVLNHTHGPLLDSSGKAPEQEAVQMSSCQFWHITVLEEPHTACIRIGVWAQGGLRRGLETA